MSKSLCWTKTLKIINLTDISDRYQNNITTTLGKFELHNTNIYIYIYL